MRFIKRKMLYNLSIIFRHLTNSLIVIFHISFHQNIITLFIVSIVIISSLFFECVNLRTASHNIFIFMIVFYVYYSSVFCSCCCSCAVNTLYNDLKIMIIKRISAIPELYQAIISSYKLFFTLWNIPYTTHNL